MKKLIPQKQIIIGLTSESEKIEYAIEQNIPVLLIGETGLGKTALVRHYANKMKQPLRRVNLNGQTTVDDFVGKMLLDQNGTFWQDGVLVEAMRKGYWLVLDEVNAALPEILFVLHSLLDDDRYVVLPEKDGEIVRPHKNFRVFATMNPSGRYTGTKELNKAFLSRFPIILQLEYPSSEHELTILKGHTTKVKELELVALIKMANELRKGYAKGDMEYICSTRDLINCVSLADKFPLREAITLAILNRGAEGDKKGLETVINLFFGRSEEQKASDIDRNVKAENTRIKATLKSLAIDTVGFTSGFLSSIERKSRVEMSGAELNFLEYIHGTIHNLNEIQFSDSKTKIQLERDLKETDEKLHLKAKEVLGASIGIGASAATIKIPKPFY